MPGDSHPTDSGHPPEKRMASHRRESNYTPEVSSRRPRSWEATLWGRHIRCHELDRHVYLDGRFLDLTPIEFGLFWLLLRQVLQVNTDAARHLPYQHLSWDERSSPIVPEHYLEALGIVPILALVQSMSADVSLVISHWPAAAEPSGPRSATAIVQLDEKKEASTIVSRSRATLNSHLDRLRSKLRCHGLDIGTVLLYGRSARGYLLCPLGDGITQGGSTQ
jgi:hypothetical protein